MRSSARETAFKIIFATQFCDNVAGAASLAKGLEKLTKDDLEYCDKVVSSVSEHKDVIAKIIDEHSRLFPEAQLFPADRSILMLAIAEILYFDDIPSAVSVNEAANIASKYSSLKSANFISGILAEIIREKEDV